MRSLFRFVTNHPRLTIGAVLLPTFFFAAQIPRLRISADLKDWIPARHPAAIFNQQMEEEFGAVDPVIVGVVNEGPEGIFTPHTLKLIYELTRQIEALDGVMLGDIEGLASSKNIVSRGEVLAVEPFMERAPEEPEEIEALRRAVFENDMFAGNIVSGDGRAALITAKFDESRNRKQLYLDIADLVKRYRRGNPEKIFFTGRPVLEGLAAVDVPRDISRMLPVVALVVVVILYLTFRCLRGVVLPLFVIGASIACALGIMAIAKVPLYLVATWIPIILVAIGCAYGIHILNRYFEELRSNGHEKDPKAIVRATMEDIWKPVAMASLTTSAGFLSLVTVEVNPIRAVGIFTSIGILCAAAFSFTFIPAALAIMPLRPIGAPHSLNDEISAGTGFLDGLFALTASLVCRYRTLLLLSALLISLGAVALLPRLYIDDGLTLNLSQDNEILKAHRFLNELMGGSTVLSIVVDGGEADSVKDPGLLHRLDALQRFAEGQECVGETLSLAEYLKRMNYVMNDGEAEFHSLPDSRELAAQYLLLYAISGDPDDFDEVVDYDYRKANVMIRLKWDTAARIRQYLDTMAPFLEQTFGSAGIRAVPTGHGRLIVVVVDLIISGLLISLFTAMLIVFLITALMFRSPLLGLIALIPISVATLVNFAVLSTLGMRLGVATAMNSCIGIGIGVDYAIHFVDRYRKTLASRPDIRWAVLKTNLSSGKAIFFNALVVALGFLTLIFSVTPPNKTLGFLVSLNMVTSFFGAMTVLPAVLSFIPPNWVTGEMRLFKGRLQDRRKKKRTPRAWRKSFGDR